MTFNIYNRHFFSAIRGFVFKLNSVNAVENAVKEVQANAHLYNDKVKAYMKSIHNLTERILYSQPLLQNQFSLSQILLEETEKLNILDFEKAKFSTIEIELLSGLGQRMIKEVVNDIDDLSTEQHSRLIHSFQFLFFKLAKTIEADLRRVGSHVQQKSVITLGIVFSVLLSGINLSLPQEVSDTTIQWLATGTFLLSFVSSAFVFKYIAKKVNQTFQKHSHQSQQQLRLIKAMGILRAQCAGLLESIKNH
ncbi:MAG: hypothetical protein KDD40_00540 [Bdellovibrionales bacterium]|nr:hypothetical protein [Bdellovibrionales bacterium]